MDYPRSKYLWRSLKINKRRKIKCLVNVDVVFTFLVNECFHMMLSQKSPNENERRRRSTTCTYVRGMFNNGKELRSLQL